MLKLVVSFEVFSERFSTFVFNSITGDEQLLQLDVSICDKGLSHGLGAFWAKTAVHDVQMGHRHELSGELLLEFVDAVGSESVVTHVQMRDAQGSNCVHKSAQCGWQVLENTADEHIREIHMRELALLRSLSNDLRQMLTIFNTVRVAAALDGFDLCSVVEDS
jgi:hypothetical protein